MTNAREEPADARRYVPDTDDLGELARAVQSCHRCELYRGATQAVFGSGPGDSKHVRLMLLGEQPGDVEDKRGEPFVGPAGGLLRRALSEAGVDEGDAYMTNAVKHFRWRADPRGGKRRIHQRPDAGHVRACRPWWQAEVRLLRPAVLVALGATAGEALFGSSFRVGAARGHVLAWTLSSGDEDRGGGSEAASKSRSCRPCIRPRSCAHPTATRPSRRSSKTCAARLTCYQVEPSERTLRAVSRAAARASVVPHASASVGRLGV